MLIVMGSHATEEQIRAVCEHIECLGLKAHPIPGTIRTAIGITGNNGAVDLGVLESLPGVVECIPVSKPYKLVSRDAKEEDSVLRIPTPAGDVLVGGKMIALVAGPCAVETEEQCFAIAERVKGSGARLFRGGAYKPRTSPYSFQGLGLPGLKILAKVRRGVWLWNHYRGHRQRESRSCRGICRRDSNRRAEHAEFFAAEAGGSREEAGALETRNVSDAGRFLDGRGIYFVRGKLQRDVVRAWNSNVFRFFAQHFGPGGRARR